VSETTERTRAPRPMFTGTLHLPSRSAPIPEPPAPPVRAPAPPPAAPGAGPIARRVADLAECRRRFPVLFDADRPLPLAIGIHKPLAELFSVKRAGFLLKWWTRCPAYVAAVAAGGRRYNLDGTDAGEITEEQRSVAGDRGRGAAAEGRIRPVSDRGATSYSSAGRAIRNSQLPCASSTAHPVISSARTGKIDDTRRRRLLFTPTGRTEPR